MENKNNAININLEPLPNSTQHPIPEPDYKIPIIITSIIICLGLIGCIAALFMPNGKLFPQSTPSTSPENIGQKTEYENLTKDEAIAFLKSSTSVRGIIPKNYVGDEILRAIITEGNTIISEPKLIYSYDSLDELKQLAYKNYYLYNQETKTTDNAEEYFEIREYDYYAIVTLNKVKRATSNNHVCNGDCDSLLSFKKQYLNYYEEVISNEISTSVSRKVRMNTNLGPKVIDQLLRVYSIVGRYDLTGHGSIYDYSFSEQSDKYVLTTNNVGAGINMERLDAAINSNTSNPTHFFSTSEDYLAINLYQKQFNVDKTTGDINLTKINDSTMITVKSFPISQEEFRSLPFYGGFN